MHGLGIVALIYTVYMILKEKLEKPLPKDAYYDWDEYWKDIENGVPLKVRQRKQERMEYYKSPSNPNWRRY